MSAAKVKNKPVRFGDYVLTGRLGEGGMCHVFRAYKGTPARECAIKMLREERRHDEQIVDLFVTEADLSLLLRHPNLVETFEAGEVSGRHYIAMELIEGGNLREISAQCKRIGIQLPPDFAMYIVSEMLEGLQAVHGAVGHSGDWLGLVHRDVTPQNIFVSFDGRVILGDLGIAQINAYGEAEQGTAVGKLGYLSPEQVSGEPIDARSDLFSLSIVLFEILTGEPLFDGLSEEEVLQSIAEARVPKLRKVKPCLSRDLESFMQRALMRRPRDRFQSAGEMLLALEPCWSTDLGSPRAIGGLLCGLFRDKAREVRERREAAKPASARPKKAPARH
ncbi:MAG: serine/threonine protein kinase [Deltaproteobacteria bacterium]|nr:serine/threonine protein kinase [Deltaproteobacteria bacterium]